MRLNWMYGALLATAMVAPSSAQIAFGRRTEASAQARLLRPDNGAIESRL
jgi:hypothetical protein